jgi:hypothetical protein
MRSQVVQDALRTEHAKLVELHLFTTPSCLDLQNYLYIKVSTLGLDIFSCSIMQMFDSRHGKTLSFSAATLGHRILKGKSSSTATSFQDVLKGPT